jgi:hypothetical protein
VVKLKWHCQEMSKRAQAAAQSRVPSHEVFDRTWYEMELADFEDNEAGL